MRELKYDRENVLEYARKWAFLRNPKYYNFDAVGGDCTSFASQCIYAGSNTMNYTKDTGWYYINGNNKSPSWSGVEFLYRFLISNKGIGPYGIIANSKEIELGDIAQLSFDGNKFEHTLVIVNIENYANFSGIKIASHTYDSFNKKISDYSFQKVRFVHIKGVRS